MLKNKKQIKSWLDQYEITNYTINNDLTIDVDGNVYLFNRNLTEIPVQFNLVNGNFYCYNNKLTSLIGCPEIVNGDFYCSNNQLTSLKGLNLKGILGELIVDEDLKSDLIYKQYLLKKKIKELC